MSKKQIAILWNTGVVNARLKIAHGKLRSVAVASGKGSVTAGSRIKGKAPLRLHCRIEDAALAEGANAARLTVLGRPAGFTFFVRDVNRQQPIFLPQRHAVVTEAQDRRSYAEIEADLNGQALVSDWQQIAQEPEESFAEACRATRNQHSETWLGLGRDMRMFRVDCHPSTGYWGKITAVYHARQPGIPETDNRHYDMHFYVGPGTSCRRDVSRRLEEGCLPILTSEQREGDVSYHVTAFATLETAPLNARNNRGTDWRAAHPCTYCWAYSDEELKAMDGMLQKAMRGQPEEVVCCMRVRAVNRGRVARYAWFKGLQICAASQHAYDGRRGFSALGKDRVYGVHRLNGKSMPQEEVAILLAPGESAVFDMWVPHQPIPHARAERLARQDFDLHLDACRRYWRGRLAGAARISIPEAAIYERVRAGLLHCDLNVLGREPSGIALPNIGHFGPIGSESSPIIQFFDSMGWHGLAERCLDFFFARQRPNGDMKNYNLTTQPYQLEPGPVLWTAGEHYRYTRDDAWLRRIEPNLLKSCEYLLAWRRRNMRPELRGRGYGLQDGKVADPHDYFHSYMLNGLSYLGIKRVAEILCAINPAQAKRLAREAELYRRDLRDDFRKSLDRAPVIPFGDGRWFPAAAPWSEAAGPVSLYAEAGEAWSGGGGVGAFVTRDSLVGSTWLVLAEVLDAGECEVDEMLRSHQALFTLRNAAIMQPYYCRHDFCHLKRGEIKAFIKTYYNQIAALQDRETYTCYEGLTGAPGSSTHKTHEEAWFLMQTRWMLWLEDQRDLRLLSAIPRAWLGNGQKIELKQVASYFGPLSLTVESQIDRDRIAAAVECRSPRKPARVFIRLPHPEGRKAIRVSGGVYDAKSETVRIDKFKGKAVVTAWF